MAVTIKDVAAAAGSPPPPCPAPARTALHQPGHQERVRRVMAQLGYEPNFEAEPVEAFSKTIGIILPSSQRDVYENAFHLEIIRGIGQFCNQRRYVNTVITGQDDAEILDAIQSMVANAQADGFILLYSKRTARWRPICAAKGCSMSLWARRHSRPTRPSTSTMTMLLRERKPPITSTSWATAASPTSGVSNAMLFSAERRRGYQMSLLKHGITPREEDCVEVSTLNDAYEEPLKALLTAPDHPTAMLVSDDILAVVLEQFCGKLGLRIPQRPSPSCPSTTHCSPASPAPS